MRQRTNDAEGKSWPAMLERRWSGPEMGRSSNMCALAWLQEIRFVLFGRKRLSPQQRSFLAALLGFLPPRPGSTQQPRTVTRPILLHRPIDYPSAYDIIPLSIHGCSSY